MIATTMASKTIHDERPWADSRPAMADAFTRLVRARGERLLAVARRFLKNEDDCRDAVQDALLAAHRGLPAFAGNAALGTWLHRIVINACLMKLRARNRRPTRSIDDMLAQIDETGLHARPIRDWGASAEDNLNREEVRRQVHICINRLPEPHRQVVLLRDIEGRGTGETARLLGITAGAVKVRLHRARQALRTLLAPMLI